MTCKGWQVQLRDHEMGKSPEFRGRKSWLSLTV